MREFTNFIVLIALRNTHCTNIKNDYRYLEPVTILRAITNYNKNLSPILLFQTHALESAIDPSFLNKIFDRSLQPLGRCVIHSEAKSDRSNI